MLLKNFNKNFLMFIYVLFFLIIVFLIVKIIYKNYIIENFELLYKIKPIKKPNNWKTLSLGNKIKIYGKNLTKEHAKYVDKLNVKNIIKNLNISDLHTTKVIKILNKNDNLDLQNLPEKCVVKTNNGSGDVIIIKNSTIYKIISRGKKLSNNINSYNYWKNKSTSIYNLNKENQYQYIKPKIFVEEFLEDNLDDIKLYCINGIVEFIRIQRRKKLDTLSVIPKNQELHIGSDICELSLSRDLNILNIHMNEPLCKDTVISMYEKKKLKRMVEISEIISSIFEFARIDFYLVKDKIYFGEITLTPKGGNLHINPDNYDKEISKKWV